MAAVARQPFAPLDGDRMKTLTSLKNRQNSTAAASSKRKAHLLDNDDSENVDPTLSAKKRSKAIDITKKPVAFALTRTITTPRTDTPRTLSSPLKPAVSSSRPLQRKSIVNSTPLTAPAGRSPPRGKRAGLLTSRRRYTRVDPPAFSLGSPAPFSLDAALKGTTAGYAARPQKAVGRGILEPETKASWYFDIHEDTPEQEMTNLLQHGTCILDLSSEEENARKAAEDLDKENVPPVDHVSQTSVAAGPRRAADDMVVDKERVALGEMNAADYFPEGCDETSVVMIPGDEVDAEEESSMAAKLGLAARMAEAADAISNVEKLMHESTAKPSAKAAVLQPLDGTGESFELWESGSAKDEGEPVAA
ncbi:thymidylate kinase [Ophiocordyceps camponoti-floridani]|uniref:Thymidylate kinase n=1 Tax=Ophiocordyceps camponoti-floridani TaxID=2030778 RepID=A0A8H4QEF1_9HYPO|nr:thymidylate kinase [Ophiocordyceps camponoti-floridani]